MGSTSKGSTPLAKALRHLGRTQESVATALGMRQGAFSKLVRHVARPKVAQRVLAVVDPERCLLTELHLLYPERFEDWEPPVSKASEKAPRETSVVTQEPEPPAS